MNTVLQFLHSIYPMSDGLTEHLRSVLKTTTYKKKEILLRDGSTSQNIYFIKKGLTRCYFVDDKGAEITSWFMKEGDVISSVESFFKQTPSYEWIQALEDCEMVYVSYDDLQYIYKTYTEFNYIGRVLVEKYYVMTAVYTYNTRSRKATDRYKYFISEFPDIVQRAPSQYIASFLGLSRAHYSVAKSFFSS